MKESQAMVTDGMQLVGNCPLKTYLKSDIRPVTVFLGMDTRAMDELLESTHRLLAGTTVVAILTRFRTGSTLLVNQLNSTGMARVDHELFNEHAIHYFGGSNSRPKLLSLRREHPVHFLELLLSRQLDFDGSSLQSYRIRGFKVFLDQDLKVGEHLQELGRRNPRISIVPVLLSRRNHLAMYSSLRTAELSGEFYKGQEGVHRSIAPRPMPIFRPKHFEKFSREQDAVFGWYRKELGRVHLSPVELDYSDVRHSRLGSLWTRLAVDTSSLAVSDLGLEKQNPDDIVSRFDNPDEVMRYLEQQGKQSWAQDG